MLTTGTARQYVYESPSSYVGTLWRIVDLFVFADQGNFPVSGGVLDQSASFLRGLAAWRSAKRKYDSNE